jgi:hypothetical protein
MTEQEIVNAIGHAKRGIARYLEIMDLLYSVDLSADADFQTKFKGFYRVRQKSDAWYRSYFEFMEQNKGKRPTFAQVLGELRARIGNDAYEPSFSSKLVASLDPWSPVWDVYVLQNTGHKPPAYNSKAKHADAVVAYASIVDWYRAFMESADGLRCVRLFNENVSEYYRITDIKRLISFSGRRESDEFHNSYRTGALSKRMSVCDQRVVSASLLAGPVRPQFGRQRSDNVCASGAPSTSLPGGGRIHPLGRFCSHARSGDSDNRPTRLIRHAISRRRPAMNFFVHLIARGMLGCSS